MDFWNHRKSQSDSTSPLLVSEKERQPVWRSVTSAGVHMWKILLPAAAILVATTATATYFLIPRPALPHRSSAIDLTEVNALDCGSTSEEAMSRGCIMEPMLYGWVPPDCYFGNLSSQYDVFSDRSWYSDSNFSEDSKVSPEDIWAGKMQHLYVHRYHTEHCLFLWRKLAWAVKYKRPWLDTKSLAITHTDHCSKQLARQWEKDTGTNNVQLGFYQCVRLPWA